MAGAIPAGAIVAVALVGLGGGWLGADAWRDRHAINEACAGLVPAGEVLELSPAGGTISGRVAEEGTVELGAGLPQDCEIFSTKAGELVNNDSGERWFFTGQVAIEPNDWEYEADDSVEDVLGQNRYGGPPYADEPLGGGMAGVVSPSRVMVRLPCAGGTYQGKPVTTVIGNAGLPPKVIESRVDDRLWEEHCLLASEPTVIDGEQERPWAGLASFFGEPAKSVRTDSIDDDAAAVRAGTAGFDDHGNTFWATSVCGGRPAVHTMTLSYPYAKANVRAYAPVFRSYVTALAVRRHCARLELPGPEAYAKASASAAS
ncbi:MAG: hypothetical protein GEV11_14410 [Streptosporangiales bacterium]|nr:hypothetical protein [Streptosporangiales bacterium]